MTVLPSFQKYVMAVDRVEQLLLKLTRTLNTAEIDYAVVGGNAVAAWMATVDESAVRATKDVDLLIRRDDLAGMIDTLRPIDLVPAEVLGVHMFVDQQNPNPKTGVHILFAGERVRPHYTHPAPDPSQSIESDSGFRLIELPCLVEMKLQAYRFIDRAHIQDMLSVGLIDQQLRNDLPDDLRKRLEDIESSTEE